MRALPDPEIAFALAEANPDAFRGEPQSNRDPRRNPQPGDILRVGTDQREVVDRVQDRIEYGFPNRAASRWITLVQWQVWARTADVVKVSP